MASEQESMEKTRFTDVVDEADDEQENGSLLHTSEPSPKSRSRGCIQRYWLLALNILILLVSVAVNVGTWAIHNQEPAPAQPTLPVCVHETDMLDARPAVEYEERVFTGALVYDPETKVAFRKQDGEKEYFGPPSKELDAAWDELLHDEFPVMTDEEAAPFLPELKPLPNTHHFHFEPDMFHTLHCLNAVRGEVSKSLYNMTTEHEHLHKVKLPEGWDIAHMEHCMDRIRQAVMCHGDLTPSPLYYWKGFNIALGRSGTHTCRKWQPIRDWMDVRKKRGDEAIPL